MGSLISLSDYFSGNLIESYSYVADPLWRDVYGQPTIRDSQGNIIPQSQFGNLFMFTGREYDAETQLYYYRFRYYNPSIGRFLQTDPISYYYSMNLYEYCWNDPINWIDPFGLDPLWLKLRDPNNIERRRINDVIRDLQDTGDPVLGRIAGRLSSRRYVIDTSLECPMWGYTRPYRNRNTIYLSQEAITYMANQYGVRDRQIINRVLMDIMVHEDWHLLSVYEVDTYVERALCSIIFDDYVDEYADRYIRQLWERYLRSRRGCRE